MSASVMLGSLYPVLADEFGDPVAFINGITIGFFGGVVIVIYELHLFYITKSKFSFLTQLFSKAILYTVTLGFIIIGVISFTRGIETGVGWVSYMVSDSFIMFLFEQDFLVIMIYTMILLTIVVLTRQISKKMGPGILFNFITGKYYLPKFEERVFLYLDLVNSTSIAEELGSLQYHHFLKEYIADLTTCILNYRGTIYRYVGDQITISWRVRDNETDSKPIECFYCAKKNLEERAQKYFDQFNIRPKFRGALDTGSVLTGEIGIVKSQIIFYGDVLYRNTLIEEKCKADNQELLISEYFINKLNFESPSLKLHGNLKLKAGDNIDLYRWIEG